MAARMSSLPVSGRFGPRSVHDWVSKRGGPLARRGVLDTDVLGQPDSRMIQFRKSKKLGPFRLTVSKSGFSVSSGVKGARVSMNSKRQARRTFSIPGTGIFTTCPPNLAPSALARRSPACVRSISRSRSN